jgi:hypothetical protein
MPNAASGRKLKALLSALGEVERERFWTATGIDVDGWAFDKPKLESFKGSLADYRRFQRENSVLSSPGATTGAKPEAVCASCGFSDETGTYVIVPKCIALCVQCTENLIQEVERG